MKADVAETSGDVIKSSHYRTALKVNLHRQIGSRYVTASNAFYLASMATEYLQELSMIKDLNKPERGSKQIHPNCHS